VNDQQTKQIHKILRDEIENVLQWVQRSMIHRSVGRSIHLLQSSMAQRVVAKT
jgi:hypothetical protein